MKRTAYLSSLKDSLRQTLPEPFYRRETTREAKPLAHVTQLMTAERETCSGPPDTVEAHTLATSQAPTELGL